MCKEITTIIFSKNRACQLELLLRSLNMPAVVQYTCDKDFESGYEKLKSMYPKTEFILESNFKEDLLRLMVGDYIHFLVDDDVMINHFIDGCPEFLEFKNNLDIISLSLRMCSSYRRAPVLKDNKWEWRGNKKSWGYPMAVSSTVFRKEDILPLIINNGINIPNSLEIAMRRSAPNKSLMLCSSLPLFINNLANQVQTKFRGDTLNFPVEELEKRFLGGERLSLEYIKEVAKTAVDCFIKVNYEWETI